MFRMIQYTRILYTKETNLIPTEDECVLSDLRIGRTLRLLDLPCNVHDVYLSISQMESGRSTLYLG